MWKGGQSRGGRSVLGHREREMYAFLGYAQQLDLRAGAGEGADNLLDQPFRGRCARGESEGADTFEHRGLDVGDRIDEERASTMHPGDLDQAIGIGALLR